VKIYRRLAKGWSRPVENKDKEKCDVDGARLWIGPGDQIYCDSVHDSEDVTKGKEKKAVGSSL
jgi:hypothetical protein